MKLNTSYRALIYLRGCKTIKLIKVSKVIKLNIENPALHSCIQLPEYVYILHSLILKNYNLSESS